MSGQFGFQTTDTPLIHVSKTRRKPTDVESKVIRSAQDEEYELPEEDEDRPE